MAYILVAEDEHNIGLLVSRILTEQGHEVQVVHNGVEALAVLKQNPPDALVTDLNMPRMTGLELISIARRDFPTLPIIAVSAYIDGTRLALRVNKVHPLSKPFTRQELLKVINTAITPPLNLSKE
jgi:CheY-like chemotaxis protein